MRGSIVMKSFSMVVFRITSEITLQKHPQHRIRNKNNSRNRFTIKLEDFGHEHVRKGVAYSRRAGTRLRFVSPDRWGRDEELPPVSAPPPFRGPTLSSGCLFCDISGRLAFAAWLVSPPAAKPNTAPNWGDVFFSRFLVPAIC
jgi:hypothetical protein